MMLNNENMMEPIAKLNSWLNKLIEVGGADLHLKSNRPVHARVKSDIAILSHEIVSHEIMGKLVQILMKDKYANFKETKEFDGHYSFNDDFRFRVNIYMHLDGYSIALRLIPKSIKSIEALNLPSALHNLAKLRRGLVLITGTTEAKINTFLASSKKSIKTILIISLPLKIL